MFLLFRYSGDDRLRQTGPTVYNLCPCRRESLPVHILVRTATTALDALCSEILGSAEIGRLAGWLVGWLIGQLVG